MVNAKSFWTFLGASALVVSLAACGGGNQPVTGATPCPAGTTGTAPVCTPVQTCTQTVVESGTEAAKAKTLYFNDFSVPDAGRLDVTVDWTNASSPVGVYVVPANTCNTIDEFNNRTCNFLVKSEPSTQKPRKISTPNFAAGNYRWLLGTFGTTDESMAYQFVLSKGTGCPALTIGSPARLSHDRLDLLFERLEPR